MTSPSDPPPVAAAIVLAGGSGRRLGGVDKAALELAGSTLLDRALVAVRAASPVVVVGPARQLPDGVLGTQEEPPGGGPVAAVAAGLAALTDSLLPGADLVVVLACDMPFVDQVAVDSLVDAAQAAGPAADGAAFVDADGRRQHLAAAYDIRALTDAIGSLDRVDGAAMRHVAERLTIIEIETDPETTLDCDTWPDVRRTRNLAKRSVEERCLSSWAEQLCDALGLDLEVEIDPILDLAREAAHNVERPAAPLTTFLVGYAAGVRGGSLDDIADCIDIAAELAVPDDAEA